MEEITKHPFLKVLEMTFSKSLQQDLELNYYPRIESHKKWACFSDYCLDDKNKPNDVITFSLLSNIDDIENLSSHIKLIAPKDIKNTKKVTKDYMIFLTNYPLINFSFIINDRKKFFGKNNIALKESMSTIYSQAKEQYLIWIKNQPEKSVYYQSVIKKIDLTLNQIKQDNKVKQIYQMFLVTYLGAFVSSLIVRKTQPEIFGWFSDRDAIHEVSDHLSIDLFEYFLFGFSQVENCQFAAARATSNDKPFYDELLKIPDYIAGSLADYNSIDGSISKPKFDTVLTDYMAENRHNNFVFRIESKDDLINCARVVIRKKSDKE